MPLNKDLREFIECLNSNKVEYLVVGAFAFRGMDFPVIRVTSISGAPFGNGRSAGCLRD
jgi:hypothetical protein